MWLICISHELSLWIILMLGYNVYHQWCFEDLMQFSYSNFLKILKIKFVDHCYGRWYSGNTADFEEMRNSPNFLRKSAANMSLEHPKLGGREDIRVHFNEMMVMFSNGFTSSEHTQTQATVLQIKSASDTVHKREICQYTDTFISLNWRWSWI